MEYMRSGGRFVIGMNRVAVAVWLAAAVLAAADRSVAALAGRPSAIPVQMPYEAPPKPEAAPDTSVAPSNQPLGPEELKRAEALVPLLEGKQEFWAMGEFVHLGTPAVPVLTKALKQPGTRIRYNAIETLLMIKDPAAVPALLETAMEPNEMARIREHALRAAVRLDPAAAPPAIEARYVRQRAVVPVLIGLLSDDERFVAISAVSSLWLLTRHDSEMHDWDTSTKQDRLEWAQEWIEWWNANQETFQLPEPRKPRKPLS
jgi:HEAT repeat protein